MSFSLLLIWITQSTTSFNQRNRNRIGCTERGARTRLNLWNPNTRYKFRAIEDLCFAANLQDIHSVTQIIFLGKTSTYSCVFCMHHQIQRVLTALLVVILLQIAILLKSFMYSALWIFVLQFSSCSVPFKPVVLA